MLAVISCSESLINTFCSSLGSTLLLIENAAIDPLRLWVISYLDSTLPLVLMELHNLVASAMID